jgi:hypothetical protein
MRFDTLAPTLVRSSEQAIIWRHGSHHHVLPPPLCRRQFLQTLAGGTALGVAPGTGLLRPQRVDGAAPDINDVVPIPGTFEFQGKEFHALGPPLTAPDDDPSSVSISWRHRHYVHQRHVHTDEPPDRENARATILV